MRITRDGARWIGRAAGAAAAAGAMYISSNWLRYGHPRRPKRRDATLDRFMPVYEAREFHEIRVAAPAEITFEAGLEQDLNGSALVRGLFRGREILLGGEHVETDGPRGLLPLMVSIGWVILAHVPGREMVIGAVTKPWEARPTFEGVAPDAFAAFDTPGYVKIVFTIGAEPIGERQSLAITETRVTTTDDEARRRFRRYWTVVAPGIRLIRRSSLRMVKREAELRARMAD